MTFTTDEQGFLNAILADPDDVAPRLIYADWLDEHEQPERAKFIREGPPMRWARVRYGRWEWRREYRLQGDERLAWCPWFPDDMTDSFIKDAKLLFPSTWRRNLDRVIYRHGFVSELGVDRFHSNVFRLLETQPVRTVSTTAEAMLEAITIISEDVKQGLLQSLRTIRLTTMPDSSRAYPSGGFCILYFDGAERQFVLPSTGMAMMGVVRSHAEVAYRLGRVIGHYLTPLGITVELPATD